MIKCNITNSDDPIEQIVYCLDIIEKIDNESSNILNLDMKSLDWMTPFSALILSSKIVQSMAKFSNVTIAAPKNDRVRSYLTSIGFPLGKKEKGQSYSPINHFQKDANKAANEVFDIIDTTFPDVLKGNTIKYIISEFCDNVEQHSGFTYASIMAQYYKSKNFVDIGIIDNGISIPSLFEKTKISFREDAEAIDKAMHGFSTKNEDGRGKGLVSTKTIVEQGLKGQFYIISRQGMVATERGQARKLYKLQNYGLKGTIGYIRFEAPEKEVDPYRYIK